MHSEKQKIIDVVVGSLYAVTHPGVLFDLHWLSLSNCALGKEKGSLMIASLRDETILHLLRSDASGEAVLWI